jgi:hypothetical protein
MLEKVPEHRKCGRTRLSARRHLLGHASVQTTERYPGGKQDLQVAVNDKLGVGPAVTAGG